MNGDAPLRKCPKCGGPWPQDDAHSLRSLRFMDNLPRGITPSNLDAVAIHNREDNDAVYIFEIKREGEQVSRGQMRALYGMARWNGARVFIIQGTEDAFTLQQIIYGRWPTDPVAMDGDKLHGWLETWLDK